MPGGSKQETKQQNTSTTTLDPQLKGMLVNNYTGAQAKADSLTPYTGQRVADFNPTQIQTQGVLSAIGTDPTYGANANAAVGGAKGVLDTDTFGADNIAKYMNPYTQDVINASINDNERARQIAQVQTNMQNTAGSAFGGSRSGVANALTNEAYDRNDQTNLANLRNTGFTNAQQAAQNDANLKLTAANNVANLNTNALQTATTQAGILGAVGDSQQQQAQAQLNAAMQAAQEGQQLTIAQQQLLNSALGLMPSNQGTTSSSGTGTQTVTQNMGIGGVLGALGTGAQIAGMFSDGRLKDDVKTISHDGKGRRWVTFRYKWDPPGTKYVGVIAQEILASDPDAVSAHDSGFYRVDYSKLN